MLGMLLPCWDDVVESSAPVAAKSMFFSFLLRRSGTKCPQSMLAAHPHPDPPACTSCSFENIMQPQSVCTCAALMPASPMPPMPQRFSPLSMPCRIFEPTKPKSPVTMASKMFGSACVSAKNCAIVEYAAGAIAAPMLFASFIPASVILPAVTALT